MALLCQCSILLQAGRAMEASGQTALIAICIAVVVAALAFAGYILVRNNRDQRPEDQLSLGDFFFVSKDDLVTPKKAAGRLAKVNAEGKPAAAAERATPALKISNMRIEPATARPGDMVTIWFDATNLDVSQIGHQVILKINDRIFNVRQISILSNTIMHLNFKVLIMEPGSYAADVNGSSGIFTVEQ
jgi:hypothetical protein